MTAALTRSLRERELRLYALTVRKYHDMIATGIIEEGAPYELLDGGIVRKVRAASGEDPMSVGLDHAWTVKKLTELDAKLRRMGCHMQIQQPITIPPNSEPEPDGAVVRGDSDDYREGHPRPKDVSCVIEASDASLRLDRTLKLQLYARAGIACYVIINLVDRVVEKYTDPVRRAARYARVAKFSRSQRVALPSAADRELVVPVRYFIP